MKKLRAVLKVVFVVFVILGLVGSYFFFNTGTPANSYKGPTDPPLVEGPSGPPPGNSN